jgi:hypothetical protein
MRSWNCFKVHHAPSAKSRYHIRQSDLCEQHSRSMANNQEIVQSPDLVSRVFENRAFTAAWIVFLFQIFVSWPIRNALLVCWVYGSDAYFHHGVRVLPGKPIRFSNGDFAPQFADMVTGLGVFFVTALGLTLLLIFALRLYGRFSKRS